MSSGWIAVYSREYVNFNCWEKLRSICGLYIVRSTSSADANFYEGDIKILLNDWPYGFSENIVHLIVWTKFSFELDANTSDLTERSRKLIEEYISLLFEPYLDLRRVRDLIYNSFSVTLNF